MQAKQKVINTLQKNYINLHLQNFSFKIVQKYKNDKLSKCVLQANTYGRDFQYSVVAKYVKVGQDLW